MPKYRTDNQTGATYVLIDGEWQYLPDTTAGESILVNAGAQLTQLGRGVRDLFGGERADLAEEQRRDDALLAPLREARPVSSIAGQMLPSIATAPITFGAGLGANLAGQAALGAIEGFLEIDPDEVSQDKRIVQGAIGGVLGDIGGRMAGRVANAIRGYGRNIDLAPAAKRLEDVGGRSTLGQRIDDPQIRSSEASLASDFITNRPFEEIRDHNAMVMNRAALEAAGAPVGQGQVTESALDAAAESAEGVFNQVQGSIGELNIGEDFANQILTLEQFKKLRGLGGLPRLQQGIVDAGDYMTVRQALAEEMGRAYDKGQGQLGGRIRNMVEELDNLADAQAPADLLPEFAKAREQWRVIKLLERTNMVSGGDVNPVSFNKAIRSEFGTAATRGRGNQVVNPETNRMIETAAAVSDPNVRPIVGTSGTAERMAFREAVAQPGSALLRGLAAVPLRAAQNNPRMTGALSALMNQAAPQIAPLLGGAAGRGGIDPIYELLYGEQR
jgi:hypothetical protein